MRSALTLGQWHRTSTLRSADALKQPPVGRRNVVVPTSLHCPKGVRSLLYRVIAIVQCVGAVSGFDATCDETGARAVGALTIFIVIEPPAPAFLSSRFGNYPVGKRRRDQ